MDGDITFEYHIPQDSEDIDEEDYEQSSAPARIVDDCITYEHHCRHTITEIS